MLFDHHFVSGTLGISQKSDGQERHLGACKLGISVGVEMVAV